jgi:hypothetical protein
MHMIPQRLVVTMDPDCRALYGIIALTILLDERDIVLVSECPAYLSAVKRQMLTTGHGCPEAQYVGCSTWQCQLTKGFHQLQGAEVGGSWALYGMFHDHR